MRIGFVTCRPRPKLTEDDLEAARALTSAGHAVEAAAWDDPRVEAAIRATGRDKLIFAGVSLEVCAAFPAMRAVREGFEAYVAVDASGTFNDTKRETGIVRLTQSGVVTADASSLIVEILGDNASSKAQEVYTALGMDWSVLVGQVRASAAG